MDQITETVLTSSLEDGNVFLWDLKTNNVLKTFKQRAPISKNGLCVTGKEYFVTTQQNKNLIRYWNWNKNAPIEKFVGPETLTVISSSNNSFFFAGGTEKGNLYFWETFTGNLLKTVSVHFRRISCLKFTKDNDFLISGGDDGIINVWKVSNFSQLQTPVPIHSFTEHSLPITDIYCGVANRRIFSVSLDRSCKIYEWQTGLCLISITFPCSLTSLICDSSELSLYVGGNDGQIYQSILHSDLFVSQSWSDHCNFRRNDIDSSRDLIFSGHSKPITHLNLSFNCNLLISTSEDGLAIIWDIPSRQKLKIFNKHSGPISNLVIGFKPIESFLKERTIPSTIQPLSRHFITKETKLPLVLIKPMNKTYKKKKKVKDIRFEIEESLNELDPILVNKTSTSSSLSTENIQLEQLTKLNTQLYYELLQNKKL